jgi:hypothetical protein
MAKKERKGKKTTPFGAKKNSTKRAGSVSAFPSTRRITQVLIEMALASVYTSMGKLTIEVNRINRSR